MHNGGISITPTAIFCEGRPLFREKTLSGKNKKNPAHIMVQITKKLACFLSFLFIIISTSAAHDGLLLITHFYLEAGGKNYPKID
jgi:hypothetical protein